MDTVRINSLEEKTKFIISLDAIDINLLPATFNRYSGTEVTQLWTKGNLKSENNEYFEFEIKDKNSPDDIYASSVLEYIQCHICNIEVPKSYLKEHFKSKKHTIFKKIIDISLNRLKSIMNEMEVFEDSNTLDSEYFCTSCVTIIDKKDKGLHEKSMVHKNSLIIDKILNDFLDLYESNENTFKNKTEAQIKEQMENIIVHNQNETVEYNHNDMKESSVNSFEKTLEVDNNETVAIKNLSYKNVETINIKETLQDYVEFLNNKYHYNEVEIINGSNLLIKTISGKKIKVLDMNFYGLVKAENNSYECQLCLKHINKKEKWHHLYQKEHVERVTVTLKNENAIRVIDPRSSHCVICNARIQYETEHISSKNHKLHLIQINTHTANINPKAQSSNIKNVEINKSNNIFKETTIKKALEKKDKVQEGFCDICKIDIVADGYQKHLQTLRHKIEVTIKESKIHYLMNYQSNNHLFCVICIEHVENVEVHLKSGAHISNYDHQMLINSIRQTGHYRFYCKLCNVSFVKTKEWIHLQDKQHKNNFIKTVINAANTQVDIVSLRKGDVIIDNSFKCTICNINVPNHNYNIYTHLTCGIHKTAIKSIDTAEIMNVYYHVDLANLPILKCMVCDVQLPISEKNIMTHIKGNTHVKQYNSLLINNRIIKKANAYLCSICTVQIPHLGEVIHCKTKKHISNLKLADANKKFTHDTVETTPNTVNEIESDAKTYLLKEFGLNEVYCIACDVKIPIGFPSTLTHLNQLQHCNNYEKTLKDNYIEKLCDDFKCTQCNVILVTGKEFDHIGSRKHQDTLVNLTKYYCFICDIKLSNNEENINYHKIGAKHTQMLVIASESNIRINEDHCYCVTCEKRLKNESVLDHKNSLEHLKCEFIEGCE